MKMQAVKKKASICRAVSEHNWTLFRSMENTAGFFKKIRPAERPFSLIAELTFLKDQKQSTAIHSIEMP